jgi:uncharacterized RDD family membrane protein YckC
MDGNAVNSESLVAQELELASRWQRFGAAFVDGLIYSVFMLTLMYFTGMFDNLSRGAEADPMKILTIQLAGLVVFVLLNGQLLVKYGQTIGKRVVGIQIVALDNSKMTTQQLVTRYAVYFLIGLIPIVGTLASFVNLLIIFGAEKRCGHDYAAKTKVVVGSGN